MAKTTSEPKTSTNPIGKNTVITLTLPWAEVEPAYQSAIRRFLPHVKLQGFRKGKAPAKLAESAIGFDKLRDVVLDKLLPAAYEKAVTESKKQPLTRPQINAVKLDMGQDWVLEAEIAEAPVVELGKYKDVVKAARKQADKELTEKEAELKKQAKDGEKTAKDKPQPNTPKELTADDKRDYQVRAIFSALVREINPTVPELPVSQETRADLDELVKTLDQLKMNLDSYLARRQVSFEQLTSEMAATALGRIQLDFILNQIGEDQKVTVDEKEVEAEIAKNPDENVRKQQRENHQYHHYLHRALARKKIVENLLSL